MYMDEVEDIMQALSKLNISKMEIQDQLLYLLAGLKYAEILKPLVTKYANELPKDIKFLLKL